MSGTQTESSDGAPDDIGRDRSCERKDNADRADGHNEGGDIRDGDEDDGQRDPAAGAAKGATSVRISSKRSADTARLDEGGIDEYSSGRVDRGGQSAGQSAGPHRHRRF